jgi:hypothetical protein
MSRNWAARSQVSYHCGSDACKLISTTLDALTKTMNDLGGIKIELLLLVQ